MKKYISFALIAFSVLLIVSCKKFNFDYNSTGEAVGNFKLLAPADNGELLLNSAAQSTPIVFSWTTSAKGVNQPVNYKWKLDLKAGDFTKPLWESASDMNGTAPSFTTTHKALDSLLAVKGIAANAKSDLKWMVIASNESGTLNTTTTFNLPVTRFGIGITAFTIFAPASSVSIVNTNPNSTADFFHFTWQKASAVPASNAVRYKVVFVKKQFDANNNPLAPDFTQPLFSFASNNNGTDSVADLSWKKMSDSLNAHGLSNLSLLSQLQWTVIASASTFSSQALYFNDLYVAREIKIYMVGSATPGGWDISLSTRMIEDPRFPGTYFSYINLSVGEMKFVNGQMWPPSPGAVDWGQDPAGPAGTIIDEGESNIAISAAGVYRVTFDLVNKKFYLQTAVANGIGGMGMIGQFQGWSQPATKMNYIGVNKFLYIANSMSTNDEFKFHDGNDWVNGANNQNRWFAVDNTNGGKMVIDPGAGYDNFKWTGATGRVRAIWDGSNTTNLQYNLTPASEMRVVGNGMNGVADWTPGVSPQMTYSGNGVWTITLGLIANKEIKFLAGNDWGAFDYEDNSSQSNVTGSPRGIRYDGNDNFKTPTTTGTYTITLNENNQTVTIN